jgi:hypothetical protein
VQRGLRLRQSGVGDLDLRRRRVARGDRGVDVGLGDDVLLEQRQVALGDAVGIGGLGLGLGQVALLGEDVGLGRSSAASNSCGSIFASSWPFFTVSL